MRVREGLDIDGDRLAGVCARYGAEELSLFGSVLGEHFGPDSDIDVLVTLPYPSPIGLIEFVRFAHELELIFGRSVDLVERDTLRGRIRDEVVEHARRLYVAAA